MLISTGAVAYSIVTLLPVELILQVGNAAGYAMIFALLLAAIVWNLGTWALGIPNSSSHALIGSIMGVGLANQLMAPAGSGDLGRRLVAGGQGRAGPALEPADRLRRLRRAAADHEVPDPQQDSVRGAQGQTPPPWWIRGLLILTCTGVSFAHGGNDGQKGMGLIMLILIGAAPTAYALNRTMPDADMPAFIQSAHQAQGVFAAHASGAAPVLTAAGGRDTVGDALRTKKIDTPAVFAALASCPATSRPRSTATARSATCRPQPCPTCATTCTWPATPCGCSTRRRSAASASRKRPP